MWIFWEGDTQALGLAIQMWCKLPICTTLFPSCVEKRCNAVSLTSMPSYALINNKWKAEHNHTHIRESVRGSLRIIWGKKKPFNFCYFLCFEQLKFCSIKTETKQSGKKSNYPLTFIIYPRHTLLWAEILKIHTYKTIKIFREVHKTFQRSTKWRFRFLWKMVSHLFSLSSTHRKNLYWVISYRNNIYVAKILLLEQGNAQDYRVVSYNTGPRIIILITVYTVYFYYVISKIRHMNLIKDKISYYIC